MASLRTCVAALLALPLACASSGSDLTAGSEPNESNEPSESNEPEVVEQAKPRVGEDVDVVVPTPPAVQTNVPYPFLDGGDGADDPFLSLGEEPELSSTECSLDALNVMLCTRPTELFRPSYHPGLLFHRLYLDTRGVPVIQINGETDPECGAQGNCSQSTHVFRLRPDLTWSEPRRLFGSAPEVWHEGDDRTVAWDGVRAANSTVPAACGGWPALPGGFVAPDDAVPVVGHCADLMFLGAIDDAPLALLLEGGEYIEARIPSPPATETAVYAKNRSDQGVALLFSPLLPEFPLAGDIIHAAQFVPGVGFSELAVVSDVATEERVQLAQAAVDESGNTLVLWHSYLSDACDAGSLSYVRARILPADSDPVTGWEPALDLGEFCGHVTPALSLHTDGERFIANWRLDGASAASLTPSGQVQAWAEPVTQEWQVQVDHPPDSPPWPPLLLGRDDGELFEPVSTIVAEPTGVIRLMGHVTTEAGWKVFAYQEFEGAHSTQTRVGCAPLPAEGVPQPVDEGCVIEEDWHPYSVWSAIVDPAGKVSLSLVATR